MLNDVDILKDYCHVDDLWIYDKFIIARKLGYICGPVGVDVPTRNNYIVRPVINPLGMGRGAKIVRLTRSTNHLPLGHFWCEVFEGRHYSVDYYCEEQVLCVEGIRDDPKQPLYRFDQWRRVDHQIKFPNLLKRLTDFYPCINCEFIGDKLIEIHLRSNPDFVEDDDVIYPVWNDEPISPPEGMIFVSSYDYKRVGFYKHERSSQHLSSVSRGQPEQVLEHS